MQELKYRLCPRWLGWTLVAVGWLLLLGSLWAYTAERETLGMNLFIATAVYLLLLIVATIATLLIRRPWRKPPGQQ